ncbi:unnamed protein product [Paramecium sonneborni]|uniref:Uncharacterized protein n=1 Tax=Paramecium sonneborni TaxID=65129 RepID=A0A8S1RB16_9CILI|nr:unnamed protein product [Paramecium sonneborni]
MRHSVQLEMNKPLKYPSNDVCWPSFQSCNISSLSICIHPDNNNHISLSKFSDFETENTHVPKNLEKLCSYHNHIKQYTQKSFLLYYEKFWYSKIISSNIISLSILIFNFYLPYFHFQNSIESNSQYFPILLFLFILELFIQSIKLLTQFLKEKPFSFQLLNIVILIIYILNLKINDIFIFTILNFLLFSRNFKIIQKMLSLILFINYQQIQIIKIIIVVFFQIHYFACIWGLELKNINQEDFNYSENFYKSFLMLFFEIDQLDNKNQLLIITHLITNIIIIIFVFTNYFQSQQQIYKHEITFNNFKLFMKSNMLGLKVKLVLYHYSLLFLTVENQLSLDNDTKKKKLLEYIKMNLIKQELKHFNFLSQTTINEISQKGVLSQNSKQKYFSTEINGLFIIIAGKVNIEFMGFNLNFDNRKIINQCLIEMMNSESQEKIRLKQGDTNDILYFYINYQEFNNCLKKQIEKEKFQILREDIMFNNNTEGLNIKCYFCNLYHSTFNCGWLNVKRRFKYDTSYQERCAKFVRRKCKKITNQGTSNNQIFDISSDSFEAFSDYSSDKQSISNQQHHFDQIGKQSSIIQIHKDILQIDMISDKITDPIISSTLIKHLQVPETVIKHHGNTQAGFQDLDSIIDIDKLQEYEHYKVSYNIHNVLKIINKEES